MLHLLVLGVSLAVGIGLLGYWMLNAPPSTLRVVLKWVLIMGAASAVLALIIRGGGSYLWSLGLFLLPVILRWRAIMRQMRNAAKTAAGPTQGQASTVTTRFLEMRLDHDTGAMSGRVTAGRHAGSQLEDMELSTLLDLLMECQEDEQSARLLESYLDRVHGDDWRYDAAGAGGGNPAGQPMSRAQALEILGVQEGASDDEIRTAHRRLMLANHPDRGGSTFLAAQINRAKETLLGGS